MNLNKKLSIFMGWDPRETEAYNVAYWSILRRTKSPVVITPLILSNLQHVMNRPIEVKDGKLWCPISEAPMATEFAISRFCVPLLQHEGWALFCDSDILCVDDINNLFKLADDKYAVMVVKHQQKVIEDKKMDGQIQTFYNRKNWSSVILWNCSHPGNYKLTHDKLNHYPGRDLHSFSWLEDKEIGELPEEWNYLVGVNKSNNNVKLYHYTLGGPWFKGWAKKEYDNLWEKERDELNKFKLLE